MIQNRMSDWERSLGSDFLSLAEESQDSNWLISYADLVTLLLSFFVMMFMFSSLDQKSFSRRLSEALQGSFGTPQSVKLLEALQAMQSSPGMKIQPIDHGVEASFMSSALFESGSAELVTDAYPPLRRLVREIKRVGGSQPIIRVEGHTDDRPIQTEVYRSNWDLSGARAVTIVQFLEGLGLPKKNLEAVGLGSSRPEVPNRDSGGQPIFRNQAQNRRVVIKILLEE